jgi:RIO-like serine/threonine protein kinase
MTFWEVTTAYRSTPVEPLFETLEKVFSLEGEHITSCPISRVIRVEFGGEAFYVKTYTAGGKKLRRWLGRSRAQAEWENLQFFEELAIPSPILVAYGLETSRGLFQRAALITAELKDTRDLNSLYLENHPLLTKREWVDEISRQVAQYTRRLHDYRFVHNDLKWRNILVTLSGLPQVYFFDCPAGQKRHGPFSKRWFVKDIACLDKVGKKCLSRTQRLRFFMDYYQLQRLGRKEKDEIMKILKFFEGRE